jgi:hypothetical protein
MDGEELQYAMDFYTESKAKKQKARFVSVESDEDESYQPSPPVPFLPFTSMSLVLTCHDSSLSFW